MGLPFASRAVPLIVEVPLPPLMGDGAVPVDTAAGPVLAFTSAVAVWLLATPSRGAAALFEPAAVDDRVPVATPLASVVPTGWVRAFPPVGVAASVTVAPGIGFPLASFAVTGMVDVPLPAAIGDVAVTVDCAPGTPPPFPRTVAVWGH